MKLPNRGLTILFSSLIILFVGSIIMLRHVKNLVGRSQGYSACMRCEDTWNWKTQHTTYFPDDSGGMFPLCQECWEKLGTAEARQPYYKKLIEEWAWWIINHPPDDVDRAWRDHMKKVSMYEEALRLEEGK